MASVGAAEVREWLARTAWPLKSLAAGAAADDLQVWKPALAGVRVLGLGESTHGTSEFFQLKHRLIEFLVTELGYTVVAMEASESAAPAVDAYVRHGIGDAATVVSELGFWTWRTEEVVALVEWMRSYNAGRPVAEQVGFAGIDPQQCSASVVAVSTYLRDSAPDRLELFESGLAAQVDAGPGAAPDAQALLVREAEALVGFLKRDGAPADVVRHGLVLARCAAVVCAPKQDKDVARTTFAVRDRLMADAVSELLADPSAKVAVWAHNGHLAASRSTPELRPLGQHLRERHGDEYYALALLCGSGAFRARRMFPGPWPGSMGGPVVSNKLDRGGYNALEGQLAAANPGDHLLDLRVPPEVPEAVRQWLEEPQMFRSFGAYVQRWAYKLQFAPTRLRKEYDGVAYVATSTPSRPLPS
ncbi:erythromycin esterase [Kribbella amoyensis]|uniref:Erythromycin esterase n=1 Tax=Kribbella amoyensis TaxID=996641 RepID=A0A561BZ12_9ACTN|nr:erythromycin esterase family protein [Kribbella amoyensis]TWD84149.1 erythromycin esterase [Kribbella amoyensis]